MKDLITKAVVTGPDGFYYREEHEWHGLPPDIADWFSKKQQEVMDHIAKEKPHTKGDLTATLDATFDGVAQPTVTVSGFDRKALTKFQRKIEGFGSDLLSKGEQHAAKHKP